MAVCAQASFSQRATWPPSAAVRQFSIADITLSWPRLTWPALASRHAGPWRRKISATSSLGRANSAARQAGSTLASLSASRLVASLVSSFLGRNGVRRSSGLMTSRMVLVATRV